MNRIITKYAATSGVFIEECENVSISESDCGEYFVYGKWKNVIRRTDCHGDKTTATRRIRELFSERRKALIRALNEIDEKQVAAQTAVNASDLPENP